MRTRIGVKAPMHGYCAHNAYVTKNKTLRQTLGENAKAIRASKKLSQPKVVAAAKKLGGQIDQTTISRVERCLQPATVDSIEALAKGLGVHPWELLIPGNADEKFLAIVKAWSHATPAGRELLVIAADGAMRRDGKELERESSQDASAKRGGTGSH